ncbi:hypothetical protein DL546_001959 [Coniochaeta pulveracea]|uniref:SGNH hydrolase-type esterase domain-containing protein n=1 Tax=Coniochaeta pulveracea TaxID=177199 RepID=A0A420Y1K2_9PEZI|nr:hypothetical protein DL546_001959 [Coniochaeta pulveracea]
MGRLKTVEWIEKIQIAELFSLGGEALFSLAGYERDPFYVGAVTWDRPKADPEAHSPDVVYADDAFTDTIPPYEGSTPDLVRPDQYGNSTFGNSTLVDRAAKNFYLRIMPLGESITQGQGSTDEAGYRKALREQLRWKGWKVNMVGSKRNGAMADNDGQVNVIGSVYDKFRKSAYLKPNLVLINAGTNDCGDTGDGANAARDMKVMLDGIFDSMADVTIILSTLVPSGKNNPCASFVSQQYRDLVTNSHAGRRIGLADINFAIGSDFSLLHDDTHPNDAGYKLFAAVWWDAISQLEDVIQPPSADGPDDATSFSSCSKVACTARGPVKTQQGSGHDDGNYVHNSESLDALVSARIEYKGDSSGLNELIPFRMFFANLIKTDPNAERKEAPDDWVRAWNNGEYNTLWHVRRNKGNGEFDTSVQFSIDQHCEQGSDAHGYTWGDFIIGGEAPGMWDYTQQDFRFADIDGDGRADFCIVSPYAVKCSRNGGQGDEHSWQGFKEAGTIRDLVIGCDDKRDLSRIVLGDINGEFRADLMYVSDTGSVQTWINQRGDGNGIRSAGQTHKGQAVSGLNQEIKFGKIMGTNRLDYIYLVKEDEWYDAHVWKNTGAGGTKRKGDGSFYCDMRGTGFDDLVWIYYHADNVDEINTNIHSPPNWGHDTHISFSVPGPRVGIHLADWTGDGRCDVLVQNKPTGAITLHENQYDQSTKTITFTNRGVVASPGCSQ